MVTASFKSLDSMLRRISIASLGEIIDKERTREFRASLVLNPRTGLPLASPPSDEPRFAGPTRAASKAA